MSKELIEQLAKEHGVSLHNFLAEQSLPKWYEQLEAFAKAYQAAAPIDNVAEALEKAANACDKLSPKEYRTEYEEGYTNACGDCYEAVMSLIPQANRTEAAREQS
jgi:hypothetical protein